MNVWYLTTLLLGLFATLCIAMPLESDVGMERPTRQFGYSRGYNNGRGYGGYNSGYGRGYSNGGYNSGYGRGYSNGGYNSGYGGGFINQGLALTEGILIGELLAGGNNYNNQAGFGVGGDFSDPLF